MNNEPQNENNGGPANWSRGLLIVGLIIAAILGAQFIMSQVATSGSQITMAELVDLIEDDQVSQITVRSEDVIVELRNGEIQESRKESGATIYETLAALGVEQTTLANLDIEIAGPAAGMQIWQVLSFILPVILVGWLVVMMMRSMRGGQDQAMNFGRSRAKMISVDTPLVTFDDVAGMDESKQEVSEIVEFLSDPDKFLRMGARVPKGVLMIGPPGTGKTLLARAIAGEAGVPFLHISGSEFVEMFVGVGASRVRDLFDKAKQVAPCIIFVDEIDAVGRMRGTGLGGGHDEREQTLNQILVEMDGFENDTNIIVIAATNRADVLDPALMRPGRFDRKVFIHRPDIQGRKEILEVHMRGKPLASDVNLDTIAKLTPGFAGADIENLVNEAAILAAQRGISSIGMQEFQDAMEKIVAGPERRTRVVSPEEKRVIAYHEAGHAVVMYHLEHSDPVHKITIIPRGQAGGYTMYLPESQDNLLMSRDQLEDMIVGLMGGRAAEQVNFGRITTGASDDLKRCTSIARGMVMRFGMTDVGLRVYNTDDQEMVFLGRNLGESRDYSERTAEIIDVEVNRILNDSYQRAITLLTDNQDKVTMLAEALLERETVDREEFEGMMDDVEPAISD